MKAQERPRPDLPRMIPLKDLAYAQSTSVKTLVRRLERAGITIYDQDPGGPRRWLAIRAEDLERINRPVVEPARRPEPAHPAYERMTRQKLLEMYKC